MRLGGVAVGPQNLAEIGPFCEKADRYGISAIVAPKAIATMTTDEAQRFGETARAAGLIIGETGFWENLITLDAALRQDRRSRLRQVMINADAMGCRSVAILAGTRHPSDKPFAAHPYMFTEACRRELRDVVLTVLDGLACTQTRLGMEPYAHSFFYGPEAVRDFIDEVGHPRFGVHLDQANMVAPADFFETGELIDRTFALLKPHVVSVHLKDLSWPVSPLGLKWEEVDLGEGMMDFDAYFRHVARLDPDMTCFCEHFATEGDYARNFVRAHDLAGRSGHSFSLRSPT
ncbi:MAG: sugar phosphate isomerase/epimerase [Rhizobiaceae bacterium]|nr:sugar phosphate isomerase/epimerase [Rhizobiaceae bacterium]